MVNKITWIEQEGEKIALRKSWDGWRVVKPYKDAEGKLINKNIIGSWQSWVKSIIILLLILGCFWIYNHDTAICRETVKQHSLIWENCSKGFQTTQNPNPIPSANINFSLIK